MKFSSGRKQVASIVFGGGVNAREQINEYRARGFLVVICGAHAEVYA